MGYGEQMTSKEEIRELVQGASAEEFDRWFAEVKAEVWFEGYLIGLHEGFQAVDKYPDNRKFNNPYRNGENK